MKNIVLYIATSLDGRIAKLDGSLDWLESMPIPENDDYGYTEFLNTIGIAIMGRKTYDKILDMQVEWPYSDIEVYIVSKNGNLKVQTPNTFIISENIIEKILELKKKCEKDLWLIGGGELITYFLNNELLDKMIITVIPKIIGAGISLFANNPKESIWNLVEVKQYHTGVVNLTYNKNY